MSPVPDPLPLPKLITMFYNPIPHKNSLIFFYFLTRLCEDPPTACLCDDSTCTKNTTVYNNKKDYSKILT